MFPNLPDLLGLVNFIFKFFGGGFPGLVHQAFLPVDVQPTRASGGCQLLCEIILEEVFLSLFPRHYPLIVLLVVLCRNKVAHMIGRMQLSAGSFSWKFTGT